MFFVVRIRPPSPSQAMFGHDPPNRARSITTTDRGRQHRYECAGDARVRSRYACDVADWRRHDHGARARDTWTGTLMPVFQPAEETGAGAQAMIDDGLLTRFSKPDVVLGQHVMVGPSGMIGGR
jgi:hypothetical protein